MSYLDILSSVFGKRGVWLYHFSRDGQDWWWTSKPTPITEAVNDVFQASNIFSGDDIFNITWETTSAQHARYRVTTSNKRAVVNFVFKKSNPMAQLYFKDSGAVENTVTVFHMFENDPDAERVVKFRGRVIAVKTVLTRFTLIAEARFTQLRRKGLSAVIQKQCRHALYHSIDGLGCNLNIADFEETATCTGVSGRTVTISAAASRDDAEFANGVLSYLGKRQMILSKNGNDIELLAPIPGLSDDVIAADPAGVSIKIAPGCPKTRQVCNDRFNNLENHGGFPWMTDTPYDGKTLF